MGVTAQAIRETGGPTVLALDAVPDGYFLKRNGATIVGDPGGGGAPLSNATPQPTGVAAPGVSTEASRADHVHASSGSGLTQPQVMARAMGC